MALISGGRINIWNVVKKQFEVVHPETETARITDFADGIVQKLALTSTMTAATALQTDSWFGKLLKMVLTASGVRYNIADNGYICFGSFWGGLIIQWGSIGSSSHFQNKECVWKFPLSFPNKVFAAVVSDSGSSTVCFGTKLSIANSKATVYSSVETQTWGMAYGIVIGY